MDDDIKDEINQIRVNLTIANQIANDRLHIEQSMVTAQETANLIAYMSACDKPGLKESLSRTISRRLGL